MLPYPQFSELSGSNFSEVAVATGGSLQPLSGKSEVHLWLQTVPPLEKLLPQLGLLSPEECRRAERLQLPADRRRFLAGRLGLRSLLSRYSGIPPQGIPLDHSSTGKPYWRDPPLPLQFNLSHSHERVLIGLRWQYRIGVDLEWVRPVLRWQRIAQRYFSAAEQGRLASCPAPERDALFFQMWTQKEALLKGTGRGLAGSRALGEDSRWVTLPLQVAGGYAAAVALEMRGEIPEDGGEALTVRLYTDVEG